MSIENCRTYIVQAKDQLDRVAFRLDKLIDGYVVDGVPITLEQEAEIKAETLAVYSEVKPLLAKAESEWPE